MKLYKVNHYGNERYYFKEPKDLEWFNKLRGSNVQSLKKGQIEALRYFGANIEVKETQRRRNDDGQIIGGFEADDGWTPPFQDD